MKNAIVTRRSALLGMSLGALVNGCSRGPVTSQVIPSSKASSSTPSPNADLDGDEAFGLEIGSDLKTVIVGQPFEYTCNIVNYSSTTRSPPRLLSSSDIYLIDANASQYAFIRQLIPITSGGFPHYRDDPDARMIRGKDFRSYDQICYRRELPGLLRRHLPNFSSDLFGRIGNFAFAMAAYEAPPTGLTKPPVLVSKPISVDACAATEDEAAAVKVVSSVCSFELQHSRKEKLGLIEQLEEFLVNHPQSTLLDDVRRCLGMLYSQVDEADPERPGREIDWAAKAKGLEHRFAVSPARGVLYRQAVAAMDQLKFREVQMRLDVAGILQKLRDHPPFPDRAEYTRRRKWLARQIEEVEQAAKENFNRPISPLQKPT